MTDVLDALRARPFGVPALSVTYPRYDIDERIDDSEFAGIMLNMSQPVVKMLPDIFEKKVDAFK
jgi:hypothetical protein